MLVARLLTTRLTLSISNSVPEKINIVLIYSVVAEVANSAFRAGAFSCQCITALLTKL